MMHFVKFIKVFVIISHFTWTATANDYMNPEWIDPHAWSDDGDPLTKLCPKSEPCKPCGKDIKPEYLRLVNSLFNPDEFRFDESTDFLYRTVHIHVTKKQLEKLKRSEDITEIDGLVSEILAQTQFGTVQMVKELTIDVVATIWEKLPNISIDSFLPRSKQVFINFVILVFSYFMCRRFNVSFLIALFFAAVYFLYEYLDYECHMRIELDEAVDFIYGKQQNPCIGQAKGNWYDWLLGKDSRTLCRNHLAKTTRVRNQCGIVDLFHEFTTNILLKQLKLFIMSIAELVGTISTTNGILITAVTLYFMRGILSTIIHSVFKFILNPTIWSRVVADMSPRQAQERPTLSQRRLELEDDIRELNLGKALDLANNQMQLLLRQNSVQTTNLQPSAVEVLPISENGENENPMNENSSEKSEAIIEAEIGAEAVIDANIDDHNLPSSNGSDLIEDVVESNINVIIVDRSLTAFRDLPTLNNSDEIHDANDSQNSQDSELSSDIEFISNLSTSTENPNINKKF